MVVGVQGFDALTVHGGGTPVLPLVPLFDGIAAHPTAPEYWWLYAPPFDHDPEPSEPSHWRRIAGARTAGVPSLLLRSIPAQGNVPKFDRAWVATVLTAQVAVGAALGIAAQALLVIVVLGYVMPFFGLELLDMARDVAAFNLPARVGQAFGVSL